MKTKLHLLLFLVAITFPVAAQESSSRYALVIGIQNYTGQAPLRNALNDATDMATALRTKGFRVDALLDPKTKKEIRDALTRYYNFMEEKNGAVGIIYYAGHGVQYEGENYLIPATASLQIPGDLDDQCVKMNTLMSVLNSSRNLNILLLDACRNNAFQGFTRSTVKGLSAVEAPTGSIVVFATQPNTTASDGTGRNGLFTSKLLRYINVTDLHVGEVLRKVKQDVNAESGGKQLPSVIDNSLGGDFYFTRTASTNSNAAYTPAQLAAMGDEQYNNKNYAEAAKWYRQAADQGHTSAQTYLGYMYQQGQGVPKDETEAVRWYRQAANQGYATAQTNLGWMYQYGQGISKDEAEAARWYRLAADQGYSNAQNNLGLMHQYGQGGLRKDDAEAVRWFRKSADQGDANGQTSLGYMYQRGLGVSRDEAEAVRLYREAADKGHANGQANLGYMYQYGLGVNKDEVEAVKRYRQGAEQGNTNAQINLGYMYEKGFGISKDEAEAVRWYHKAAEQGDATAQANLGYMYEKGFGISKDEAEAVRWYRKAADQGHANGQSNLGTLYANGLGIPKDEAEAIRWWRKAADQGHVNGQANLGWAYQYGRGVAVDKAEAVRWYKLAAAQNSDYAKERLRDLGISGY